VTQSSATGNTLVQLRAKAVDVASRRILLTNFRGTAQESNLRCAPNCGGFGRIRHFSRDPGFGWVPNPLPIDPACKALGLERTARITSQVFQISACDWRCWYCYVPYDLLRPESPHAAWLTPDQLVDLYLLEQDRSCVIDLTGGNPEIVTEWVPWMMQALTDRGVSTTTYLWSDDNLSSDSFWRFLDDGQRRLVASYRNYGRVCCFKGFSEESFAFNTQMASTAFHRQFTLFRGLLEAGLDLYAYGTFTCPSVSHLADDMETFVDRLQEVDPGLPLRTVPLRIREWGPVTERLNDQRRQALSNQYRAVELWERVLESRFSESERAVPISEVRWTHEN
jgi:uncharacterized Fe-S cluster-containing radical SAM superfamily protein